MDPKTAPTYVCPMHPEITSDKPGSCSICGMALVDASTIDTTKSSHTTDAKTASLQEITWKSYLPLTVIGLILTACSAILSYNAPEPLTRFATTFMTGFFLVFAGFKLMDLSGFAEGYRTYDLLAKRIPAYGYIYPFIELAFGLIMLAGLHTHAILWAEFALMLFSGIGVAIKIAKKEPFMCACLGTFLKVPLTYVTLIEDFGMAALALLLIYLT